MNNWQKFVKEQYGNMIYEFFKKVNYEIADVRADSEKKGAILLLNTKKGYWMYKVFEREEKQEVKRIEVCSDRYVKKIENFSRLKGKLIYLLDDTLSHGYSLLETYKLLANNIEEKYICPVVFALEDTVDLEKEKGCAEDKEAANFWTKLKFYTRMSEKDISKLSLKETELLHEEGIPFVIDLPYLKKSEVKDAEMNFEVILDGEQFRKLQNGNKMWVYHPISCEIEDINVLQGFVIQMKDELLLEKTKEFVYDLVIEGTYVKDEAGNARVVFIPFAILKSMTKAYLKQLHEILCGEEREEAVEGKIQRREKRNCSVNACVRYYRECAYVVSMMIAEYFMTYMEQFLGLKLSYDYRILREHFPENTIQKLEHLEKRLKSEPDILAKKMDCVRNLKNDYSEKRSIENRDGKKVLYTAEQAHHLILKEIRARREKFIEKNEKGKEKPPKLEAIVSFEEMQKFLREHFVFESQEQERYALTRIIVTFFQASICSNQLLESADGKSMIKGARYGENSDLILPFFDLRFYWAVVLMVEKNGKKKTLEGYERFVNGLEQQYERFGLLKKDTALNQFIENKDYYRYVLKKDLQLYNKFFFLEPYFQGKLDKGETSFMENVEEFVQEYKA